MVLSTRAKISLALVAIPLVWRISGYLLRQFLIRRLTVIEDIKRLGQERARGRRIRGNAVICGGRYEYELKAVCALTDGQAVFLVYGQHASVRTTLKMWSLSITRNGWQLRKEQESFAMQKGTYYRGTD